ncbi:MAG: NAD(P)/FAD-dependent oxidoreductase [Thermodesulfobacteriota bacterium]|nr:NAD(P)/FAD-dependent oxidoreductase [Thermodesulfobacteriota bacterium]
MAQKKTFIAIVGGGPAGLIAALYLARLPDTRIVVYEKNPKAAYAATPCAEGISLHTLQKLEADTGFCCTPFIARSVEGIRVIFPDNATCIYNEPGATLDRDAWQRAMADEVKNRGIEILYNTRIRKINDLEANFIIGADGPASRVRAAMGGRVDMVPACQYRMRLNRAVTCFEFYFHPMFHHHGRHKTGYGWVFPRDDVCNVGVKGPFRLLDRFIDTWRIDGEILEKAGAPIPINGSVFENSRMFLIGDAGGMPNPLTFGGLSPIVHCADFLCRAINAGRPGVYTDLIRKNHFFPPYWTGKKDLFYDDALMNRMGTIYDGCRIYPPSFRLIARTLKHPGFWRHNLRLVRHLRRIKRVSW